LLTGLANVFPALGHFSDQPEETHDSTVLFKTADSYEHALQVWKTPEDIRAWIAAHFSYDMARAMRLSETERAKHGQLTMYTPAEVFATKAGVCVDLSRFAVETLKVIDPQSDPKYLMIDFDPVTIAGNTLRRHWLVSFQQDGRMYFFADSRRPGHIAGPYNDLREFIYNYERYRGRKIVAFREVESYQKRQRIETRKLQRSEKP
jgi:Transglutaminase-like domain